jgi:hypothetical protein
LERRFHQPADEYLPKMDFTGHAKLAMFSYGLEVQAAFSPNGLAGSRAMSLIQSGSGANRRLDRRTSRVKF